MKVRIFFRGLTLFVKRNETADHGVMALLVRGHEHHAHVPSVHWSAISKRSVDPFRCRLDVQTPGQAVEFHEFVANADGKYPASAVGTPSSVAEAMSFKWVPHLADFAANARVSTSLLADFPDLMVNSQIKLRGGRLMTSRLVTNQPINALIPEGAGAETQLVFWPRDSARQNGAAMAEEAVWVSDDIAGDEVIIRLTNVDAPDHEIPDLVLGPNGTTAGDLIDIVVSNLPFPPALTPPPPDRTRECGDHFEHFFELLAPRPGGPLPFPCPCFDHGVANLAAFGPATADFPIVPEEKETFMLPEDRPICPPAWGEEEIG